MSISGLPQGRGKMRAPTPAPPSRFSAAFAAYRFSCVTVTTVTQENPRPKREAAR